MSGIKVMKRLIILVIISISLPAYAARITIDDIINNTTPKLNMQDIDTNFTENYASIGDLETFDATIDTESKLKVLYNLEDADIIALMIDENIPNTITIDLAATFTASANNSADETVYPVFVDGATGAQGGETDTGLTYNPSSGLLSMAALMVESNTVDFGDVTENYVLTFNAATNTWAGEVSIQQSDMDAKVNDTGNETIAGIKTFSSSPIVPAPTTDLQASTKKYVDDSVGGAVPWNTIGDAGAAGTVDFVTYQQDIDVGTGGLRIGDGGSNYVAFTAAGAMTFAGTASISFNMVSDYSVYTPSATTPATTDGLIRNVTGLTGLGDTFGFWDGTAAQYFPNYVPTSLTGGDGFIYNATDDIWKNITFSGAFTLDEDGVATLSATGGIATTGTITGKLQTATDPDAHTLSEAEYHGGTVLATGAGIYTLPTAADGYSGCVEAGQGVTAIIQLLPAAGDYIVSVGARGTAATSIKSDGSAGDRICYRCYNADDWYVSVYGTWAE